MARHGANYALPCRLDTKMARLGAAGHCGNNIRASVRLDLVLNQIKSNEGFVLRSIGGTEACCALQQ